MNVFTELQLFSSFPSFISSNLLLKRKSCLHPKINLAENNSRDLHKKWLNNEVWKQLPSIRKLKQSMNFDLYLPPPHWSTTTSLRVWRDLGSEIRTKCDYTVSTTLCKSQDAKFPSSGKTHRGLPGRTPQPPWKIFAVCVFMNTWRVGLAASISNPRGQIWLLFAEEKNLGYSSDANQQSLGWCPWWGTGSFPCNPSKCTSEL